MILAEKKAPIILSKTFRILKNLSKMFGQAQSFFIAWNKKQMTFVFIGTGIREGKEVVFPYTDQKFHVS